ncbi:MAG: hypothetical protein DMG04_14895 [Acidobacteria bacterium]|nr:MAG: hypothetical protein DMG04_14895 [Acidobacteriota bacterium]PYQ88976.1 MAG: hypothetical protein DMG03_02695 [Acidobacteriota bacterium]PYQ90567.1 MAG: hypothetical protein DMG02_09535 [Acidobacteriota bacterium]
MAEDPSALNRRQSRNENHRTPLHFALLMNRQEMIALLLEPGADPLSVDGSGQPVAFYKEGTTEEERAKIREELTHLSAMAAIVPSRLHASRRRKREARENLLHAAVTPRAEAPTEKQTVRISSDRLFEHRLQIPVIDTEDLNGRLLLGSLVVEDVLSFVACTALDRKHLPGHSDVSVRTNSKSMVPPNVTLHGVQIRPMRRCSRRMSQDCD